MPFYGISIVTVKSFSDMISCLFATETATETETETIAFSLLFFLHFHYFWDKWPRLKNSGYPHFFDVVACMNRK